MRTVVFSDRDGTINEDKNYYLGSNPNWKKQVQFLDGVVEGIALINSIPDSHFFIITNQAGVALKGGDFDNLTEQRMHEVNEYIVKELAKKGCRIDGCHACPYVDGAYLEKYKERKINPRYVRDNHPDLKPNTGMITKALKSLGITDDYRLFMIGDRASDVEMGLRAGGTGILIEGPKTGELGDMAKVLGLSQKGSVYIAKNFLEAAKHISSK